MKQVGEQWEHTVFGTITIIEVKFDCNQMPYYLCCVDYPAQGEYGQLGNNHFDGRVVVATESDRFMTLLN